VKSDDNPPRAILDLAHSVRDLERRAAQQYRLVVDDILNSNSRDVEHIEHTLDGLLDFCGHEPVVQMYRQLCRHYWLIDPATTALYVDTYRQQWDSDEQAAAGRSAI
jgi:hypothetical protein